MCGMQLWVLRWAVGLTETIKYIVVILNVASIKVTAGLPKPLLNSNTSGSFAGGGSSFADVRHSVTPLERRISSSSGT